MPPNTNKYECSPIVSIRNGANFILMNADIQLIVMKNPTVTSLMRSGNISGMIAIGNDWIPIMETIDAHDNAANGIQFTVSTLTFRALSIM